MWIDPVNYLLFELTYQLFRPRTFAAVFPNPAKFSDCLPPDVNVLLKSVQQLLRLLILLNADPKDLSILNQHQCPVKSKGEIQIEVVELKQFVN